MRVIAGLLASLLSTAAAAQTKPTIPHTGQNDQGLPVATLRDLAGVFSLYADYSGLQAEIARALAAEGSRCALDASSCTVQPTNATSSVALGTLFGDLYVVPDWFKSSADGADDAPSIRRAQATGVPLHFRCRHYKIASPSTFTNRLQWLGCGFQMSTGFQLSTPLSGTWLDVDAAFQVPSALSSTVPFTITGTATTGSVIEGFGISQPHPYPAANATTWTPNNYDYVFFVANTGGEVSFRHTFWPGIVNGINSYNSGRFDVSDLRGQFFNNAITVDQARDVVRIVDVHSWPYWADNVAVETYQQAHLDTLVLARVDTPFVSRLFSIGSHSGIRFKDTGNGVATGGIFNGVSCDFTQYCIYVDNTALYVTFQVDAIRSFAQAFAAAGSPATMLANSSVLQVEGQIYSAQIGSIVNFGTSTATVSLANSGYPSNLEIQSILVQNVQFAAPNTQMIALNGNGSNAVYLATPPVIMGTKPVGYSYANTVASGGLFTPSYAKLTGSPP